MTHLLNEHEIDKLKRIRDLLTPITTDDEVTNAYKLGAFALIINAIKHQWEIQDENNKRI
tara:strand:+ start:289 stop:468 length:180 start_codon:yes stop_codon:yes gene_type:complete